ncbi:Serine/threonine protein kinase [Candidatus Pantoea symbiotica]|jgi:serine/threonine protein kinase|uniref:Serine/threonine protein kinase n=1 Tax=Candidatus Pantoea symbiotica TaxID=1884370 RepID=A0A1I3TA21_9GAMM|nr:MULTISPECIES: serine/threonine-protein kinase [Pantoea]KAJ9432803.1 serine/threonine-protein kinase [Pantoea sp. YR343]MRT23600.1 protein kinase [Enterobacteriaceae bacterium RIT697]SFJ66611.1 Serine/threonine protein kinase [Pantoea symbiotica]SFU51510.1 Serine/threonine protein kinase [Pantoea sp. YR525]
MSANENHTPNALPAGYRFNEFEIKEVIGGGGFGIVYRAWDHQLERTIAIKEYMPVSLAVRAADMSLELRGERFHKLFTAGRNSFIQEARLLARFNHPGLLHVLRFWEENGTAYMGTLYYSGMTLKEWQITSPDSIDESWIRRLLPPLFGAIDTIHAAGYLHRDISLDNIQIQENQLPVLLDFGSARKEIGNLSDETEIMLKPGFAPIEQYSEEGEIEQGPWTDIYALGAVLHNLITGHAPPVSVVRCIEDNYQPLVERKPEGYSLPLLHAIDCALAMKPEDRPQSIDAFANLIDLPVSDVEALSTNIPVVAEPVVPAEPIVATPEPQVLAVNHAAAAVEPLTPRNVRRLSPGLVVAAAIAVLAVVVVVWKANRHSEVPPVAASTTPAAPAAPANNVASTAPTVATVYLRLQAGENVMLNGEARDVKPSSSGFASLNLAAGNYRIEVRNGNQVQSQSLTIDKPGTWLINPAQ